MNKKVFMIIVLVLLAGTLGWWARDVRDKNDIQMYDDKSVNNLVSSEVKDLVSYKLPDGWSEESCPESKNSVFIVPRGANILDCNSNPSAPVRISIDTANNKDCNQLQNIQNVSKHTCISEFINGKKSLKAETIYNQDSPYQAGTTINAYYIDIGKAVIKLEFIRSSDNEYQVGFDQIAKSVQAR